MGFEGSADRPYDRKQIYRRIRDRLSTQSEFEDVRYVPSRNRPRMIRTDVEPALFVDESYPGNSARLEIEFDVRWPELRYWIQWIEPDRGVACGWHRDETHPDLGACHFQIERPDGTTERKRANDVKDHPLAVVEARLDTLPDKLARHFGE